MLVPDLETRSDILPFFRDVQTVAIGAADYAPGGAFVCQIVRAGTGTLKYRCLAGAADQHSNGLTAGQSITGPGGGLVGMTAIRGNHDTTTVKTVLIGWY